MITAASASAGSLTRQSSSEVLLPPWKPERSAVTGWVRPGLASAARRSFHLRALVGRWRDDHRRRRRRRLLGFWLRRPGVIGCGGRRGRTILGGVLAHLGLWLRRGHIAGRCGGCRRAVLAGILGTILGRRCLGLWLRRGMGGGSARRRCAILILVLGRRWLDHGGLLLFRLRLGRRLRARRRRLGAGIDEHRLAHLLQRRGALRLRRAQAGEEDRVGRLRIVIGDEVVLVFGCRPFAMAPAHFVA